MSKKSLTPGSVGRIYRDGHDLQGTVNLPADGPFTLRHLSPGNYTVRDECGGEHDFVVSAYQEETVVKAWAGEPGQGVEPGSSHVQPFGPDEKDSRPYDPLNTPGFPNVGPDRAPVAPNADDHPGKGPRAKNVDDEPHGAAGNAHVIEEAA